MKSTSQTLVPYADSIAPVRTQTVPAFSDAIVSAQEKTRSMLSGIRG